MGSMFSQWIDGQPWWLTLLLLPALILAAIVAKLLRDAAIVLGLALVLGVATAVWIWVRRR